MFFFHERKETNKTVESCVKHFPYGIYVLNNKHFFPLLLFINKNNVIKTRGGKKSHLNVQMWHSACCAEHI